MVHSKLQRRSLGLLGGALALALVACSAKWYFKADGKFLGAGGSVEFHYDGTKVKPEKLPDDTRVDMEFLDEQGQAIPPGAQGVGAGDEVAPPDGAVTVVLSGPSGVQTGCIGCSASPQGVPPVASQDPGRAELYFEERWIHVETIVPDIDGSNALGNVVFHAQVRVPLHYTAVDVYELVHPILLGGAGTSVPNDPSGIAVDVALFQRIRVNLLPVGSGHTGGGSGFSAGSKVLRVGGLEFETMDVTSAFVEYDLAVDGHPVADVGILSTSNHESAPNGWRVVRLTGPELLLDYSSTHANLAFELRVRTAEDVHANQVGRTLEAWQ